MENIPGFFDVKASQMPEPVWLRRFFEATGAGFLLDLPHVWLEAHYHDIAPSAGSRSSRSSTSLSCTSRASSMTMTSAARGSRRPSPRTRCSRSPRTR